MNDEKRKQRAAGVLDEYLTLRHKRRTAERHAILSAALDMKSPFPLEDLEIKLAGTGFRVSKATVYNAMALFAEAGLSRRVRLVGRADCWEMCDPAAGPLKVRLVCSRCGKVREVRDQELGRSLSLRRFTSFSPSFFDLYVSGLCNRCRGGGTRARKKK